jgi:hypothetical protein
MKPSPSYDLIPWIFLILVTSRAPIRASKCSNLTPQSGEKNGASFEMLTATGTGIRLALGSSMEGGRELSSKPAVNGLMQWKCVVEWSGVEQ